MAVNIMDKMSGKWKLILGKSEGMDAFCDEMKLPADVKEALKTTEQMFELSRDGDSYKAITTIGSDVKTYIYKLGEPFPSEEMGIKSTNTYALEGEKLVGTHVVDGMTTISRTYLNADGTMISESEINGVVAKHVMEKI